MNWRVFYAKGAGAIDETLDVPEFIELHEVRLHLSANGSASETFTTKIDSRLGGEYDIELNSQDMNAADDEHYQPTRPVKISRDDRLIFAYTNTNAKTWGLEVLYEVV